MDIVPFDLDWRPWVGFECRGWLCISHEVREPYPGRRVDVAVFRHVEHGWERSGQAGIAGYGRYWQDLLESV